MNFLYFLLFLYSVFIATAGIIPLSPTALVKGIRQSSIDEEHEAMDDLDSNTFVVTVVDPQAPQDRYREYNLQKQLMTCNKNFGSDPTLISVQSSIGNTPLKDVRYSQCNQALITCAKEALDEQQLSTAGWPTYDPLERPVLRTNMLERGIMKCLRVASEDRMKVFTLSAMTEEEFKAFGTVAMCNERLILCFEEESGVYEDLVSEWDANHPQ